MAKEMKYRFFYHYNKKEHRMTVHYKKQCHSVDNLVCTVPVNSKWNEIQPYLVMQGFAKEVNILNNVAYIN